MSMIIRNYVQDPTVIRACNLTTEYWNNSEFFDRLSEVKSFNHTKDSGLDVAKKLRSKMLNIYVKQYKTWNPWSNVIGYASGNVIYLNSRKFGQISLRDRVSNIAHESFHLLGYSHKGNYVTAYNLGTVPYLVGDMFADFVMEKCK
jgi:predicted metallopeptidase